MKKEFFLISLLIITNVGVLLSQNFESFNITFDGLDREYTIYVPSSYDGLTPVPLIFSFHGGGGTASGHIAINDFSELAESENFIAVYPQAAIDPQDGSNAWIHKAPTSHDDIFFVEAIIDTLNNEFLINNDRVYACGYSEGGIFSYELACRLNSRIAAISSVSGSMLVDSFRDSYYNLGLCSPMHPTAVLLIAGTADFNPHSMYNGLQPYYMSVEEITNYWANYNNCEVEPILTNLPNIVPSDGSTVERYSWSTIEGCTYVEELKVIGGEHDWPGTFGNMDINATEEIWSFVSNFSLNGNITCANLSDNSSSLNSVVFYPNPAKDQIIIKSNLTVSKSFSIFSINGQEIITGKLNTNITKIDVGHLPKSTYILKIKNNFYKLLLK
tara:strand:+ start:1334 stop:2491 length:1158 start_codon:yes stop_codon:yes gene_type:complete